MKAATKTIPYTELNVGHIVHFYGARFQIHTAAMYRDDEPGNHGPIMSARGAWLDGAIVGCYFGPGQDWHFQGNRLAAAVVELSRDEIAEVLGHAERAAADPAAGDHNRHVFASSARQLRAQLEARA